MMETSRLVTKRASLSVAAVDAEGSFEGYASLFNVADLGGDVIMPGAFADSLRKTGTKAVKMLWQHDGKQPVGAWTALVEDARGLRASGRLNLAVGRAREAHALMKQGALDGLSIGFRPVRATRDRATGLRRIHCLELVEISLVTFPMLPQARVEAVKRAGPCPRALALRMEWMTAAAAIEAALASGASVAVPVVALRHPGACS
ncbi:MAG: HK97 family phage prohead protease [Beijerinckiaceae bacterium]